MTRRRSSAQITLVLIGTVTVAGCTQQSVPTWRDQYASVEDCTADWGRPESCERVQTSGYPGGFLFWGPPYAHNSRDVARTSALDSARRSGAASLVDPARQGRSIGSTPTSTARGGFGSSSRSYTSGG